MQDVFGRSILFWANLLVWASGQVGKCATKWSGCWRSGDAAVPKTGDLPETARSRAHLSWFRPFSCFGQVRKERSGYWRRRMPRS